VLPLIVATSVSATTIVVDGAGGGDYDHIQHGINAAGEGDTVLVMPGTYTGQDNTFLDLGGTDIVLMSSGGARSTVIDCEGATLGFFFHSFETAACVVDGFTVTGGQANVGGGMYFISSSPTVKNCVFTGNTTESFGGAVFTSQTTQPTFVDCEFTGNHSQRGGAFACELSAAPSFEWCTFTGNTSDWQGGAVHAGGGTSPGFIACTFSGNSALDEFQDGGAFFSEGSSANLLECSFEQNSAPVFGGGMAIYGQPSPTLTACWFVENDALAGAGIAVYVDADPMIADCRFQGNTASAGGGGAAVLDDTAPTFTGCVFAENSAPIGGALEIYNDAVASLTRCTFWSNWSDEGATLYGSYTTVTFDNCILSFGTGGGAVSCVNSTVTLSCCDVYGNVGGDWVGCIAGQDAINDNFSQDPLLCDPENGDFAIDVGSPCAPANNIACGLVGAWDVACDSPVTETSWGTIKAMFRQ
jgi:predicted outer membrane repeat protein